MTTNEAKKKTEAARETALAAYREETSWLRWADDDRSLLLHIHEELAGEVDQLKRGIRVPAGFRYARELKRLLATPARIRYTEYTDRIEKDPISGNPKPVTRETCVVSDLGMALGEIRLFFLERIRYLAAQARQVASPAYLDYRALYLRVRSIERRISACIEAGLAEELVDEMMRLDEELAADFEIAAAEVPLKEEEVFDA